MRTLLAAVTLLRGGSCVRAANGLNAQGEPVMGLQ